MATPGNVKPTSLHVSPKHTCRRWCLYVACKWSANQRRMHALGPSSLCAMWKTHFFKHMFCFQGWKQIQTQRFMTLILFQIAFIYPILHQIWCGSNHLGFNFDHLEWDALVKFDNVVVESSSTLQLWPSRIQTGLRRALRMGSPGPAKHPSGREPHLPRKWGCHVLFLCFFDLLLVTKRRRGDLPLVTWVGDPPYKKEIK